MNDDPNDPGNSGRTLGGSNAEPLLTSLANGGPGQPRSGRIGGPPEGGLETVQDILRKAAEGVSPPEPAASGSGVPISGGIGNTTDSKAAPVKKDDTLESATRKITFWRDGFNIQDGPLMRYDDPTNANILESINSGNAPPSTFNVRVGQPVELHVYRRLDEDYAPPPEKSI